MEQNSQQIQTKENSSSDFNADSKDVVEIEQAIKIISIRISSINFQKDNARSLNDFFLCSKEIRKEKENLINALYKYKELEQELDLPVKLEYRHALKKLTPAKKKK